MINNANEEQLCDDVPLGDMPKTTQRILLIFFGFLIFACFVLYFLYIVNSRKFPSPADLGLPNLLLFFITCTAFLVIPWSQMGFRVKKIGPLELEQILTTQSIEHNEELITLQERIERIERAASETGHAPDMLEILHENSLRSLLVKFLEEHSQWSFSASRIRNLGGKREGYEDLLNYPTGLIRTTLKQLVGEEVLETRISKKGNTLFQYPK